MYQEKFHEHVNERWRAELKEMCKPFLIRTKASALKKNWQTGRMGEGKVLGRS
jgi:hypothetical protein